MGEAKRYRLSLVHGVVEDKGDACHFPATTSQPMVLATDYDLLREKLREARKALKMINAIYPKCWDLTNGDLAVMGKASVDKFEEAHEAVSEALAHLDEVEK